MHVCCKLNITFRSRERPNPWYCDVTSCGSLVPAPVYRQYRALMESWFAGEIVCLEKDLPKWHFNDHKCHKNYPVIKPGPVHWDGQLTTWWPKPAITGFTRDIYTELFAVSFFCCSSAWGSRWWQHNNQTSKHRLLWHICNDSYLSSSLVPTNQTSNITHTPTSHLHTE